jgi:hypothetical protein
MDGTYKVRLCDAQQIVVSFEIALVVCEFRSPEILFFELLPLNHRPHPSIEDHDALLQSFFNHFCN